VAYLRKKHYTSKNDKTVPGMKKAAFSEGKN
jgi:hypothetical protein